MVPYANWKQSPKEQGNIVLVQNVFSCPDIEKSYLECVSQRRKKKKKNWQCTSDKESKTPTVEKLSLVEITDTNQPLLSKYFCNFNQTLGNVKLDWSAVIALALICLELTLHSWR